LGGSEGGRIVSPRRTQQDERFGGGYGRLCFQPRREQERQIRHRSLLDHDGENAQRQLMFLRARKIRVVVIGVVAIGKMDVDDGPACVPRQAVVVMVLGLCRVQMQERRGEKRQKNGQPGGSLK